MRARCNKQVIYTYFESKDGLFDAVYNRMVLATVRGVPLDADNLPTYAVRLFDRYRAHPEMLRLTRWYQLEKSTALPKVVIDASAEKVAAIQAAQEAGAVTRRYKAEDLLELLLCMSKIGVESSPEAGASKSSTADMRGALIDTVRRVIAPQLPITRGGLVDHSTSRPCRSASDLLRTLAVETLCPRETMGDTTSLPEHRGRSFRTVVT